MEPSATIVRAYLRSPGTSAESRLRTSGVATTRTLAQEGGLRSSRGELLRRVSYVVEPLPRLDVPSPTSVYSGQEPTAAVASITAARR